MNDTACWAATTLSAVTSRPLFKRGSNEPINQVHRLRACIDRDLSKLTDQRSDRDSVIAVR
jgi:hypothetical protein